MSLVKCSVCQEPQWSILDKNYLKLYKQCWSCDKELWEANKLSTEEFEQREINALRQEEE